MRETEVPVFCLCAAEMRRVPQGGQALVVRGSHLKERPLRREFVANNRDGSDVVYRTQEQAYRSELERTGNPRIAAYNMKQLRTFGYVPGTPQAAQAAAIDEAPGNRIGSSVTAGAL